MILHATYPIYPIGLDKIIHIVQERMIILKQTLKYRKFLKVENKATFFLTILK